MILQLEVKTEEQESVKQEIKQVKQEEKKEELKPIIQQKVTYNKLEEWTSMKLGETLFDSTIEKWSVFNSTLNTKIIGKKNVAFIIDGSPENAAKIVEMAKMNNSNVIEDNILYVKGGLPFKFIKGVSADEMDTVKTWVENILKSLK